MPGYPESVDPFDPSSANLFVRAEHLARYLFAAEFIRKRKLGYVLDCACGNGYGCRIMCDSAVSITGVDKNEGLTEFSQPNTVYKMLDLDSGLLPFTDGTFDAITCFETLEHVERDKELLGEFRRVLRRGGALLLSVPKQGYEPVNLDGTPVNPFHKRLYTAQGLEELLAQAGFAVERNLGQPYSNVLRVRMEDFIRDKGVSAETVGSYLNESPESLEFFARLSAWPVEELPEKSAVLFMVCRKV